MKVSFTGENIKRKARGWTMQSVLKWRYRDSIMSSQLTKINSTN